MQVGNSTDKPKDHCGVFGIVNHAQAAHFARLGLYSLQHRGQESAGIFVLIDGKCELHKGMGLVADVFRELPKEWQTAPNTMAIGHVRYSTAGSSALVNAQPIAVEFDDWQLAIAHNGNISNGGVLRNRLKSEGAILQGNTDTEVLLHLAARFHQRGELPWEALKQAFQQAEGAYSIVAMCEQGLMAARDPLGFRPLAMGKLGDAVIFSSETCAFDLIGAEYLRDVNPGEMIVVSLEGNITSYTIAPSNRRAHCIFELIYFARPDSKIFGECVYDIRRRFGAQLAKEAPVEADVIMPVPDGGVYAALGYSEASGILFDMGIMRNHYVGRTFIRPNHNDRVSSVQVKLNPIRSAIEGKRVCLIEDSIVRGNTSRERVKTMRKCGAREVHMRVSCPPHISPCYYGIDFPSKGELIANQYTIDEIAKLINVDSLSYLSMEGMLSCVRASPAAHYCNACFTGKYPVEPTLACKRSAK